MLLLITCGPVEHDNSGAQQVDAARGLDSTPTPSLISTPIATGVASVTGTVNPTDEFQSSTAESVLSRGDRLAKAAHDELVALTENFSPRESATDQEQAAAEYLAGKFREMGYDVRILPFSFHMMSGNGPLLKLSEPQDRELQAHPMYFSGLGRASGVMLDVGYALSDEIPEQGLEGKIALIARGTSTFEKKVSNVEEAGAAAAVIYNNEPGNFGGRLLDRALIPAISISQENGEAIKGLLIDGDVAATVSVIMQLRDSRNVVVEKRGYDGGVVVLGGHFDTVADTQGANDNGSGVATLLTVAEEASERSYPFTLRFILFGAEEVGLFGSRDYVSSLDEAEVAEIIAMVNIDVPGSGTSVEIIGTRNLVDRVLDFGESNGLTVRKGIPFSGASSDHAPFQAIGVPVVFFLADDLSRINSPVDTIEFVRPELLGTTGSLILGLLDDMAEARDSRVE